MKEISIVKVTVLECNDYRQWYQYMCECWWMSQECRRTSRIWSL